MFSFSQEQNGNALTLEKDYGKLIKSKTMNVNFNQPFVDFTGEPIKEGGKAVMVSDRICHFVFNLSMLHKEPLNGDKKYQAYKLCTRITQNPACVKLESEEATFLKEVCAEALSSGAYGQVVDIIENNK